MAAGDADADGVAVARNGLAGTIVTTAAGEAVSLRHARVGDASRKVDGFLPTATAAEAGGAALTVTWSETLDETSVPSGAGGFTVKIDGVADPAVTVTGRGHGRDGGADPRAGDPGRDGGRDGELRPAGRGPDPRRRGQRRVGVRPGGDGGGGPQQPGDGHGGVFDFRSRVPRSGRSWPPIRSRSAIR